MSSTATLLTESSETGVLLPKGKAPESSQKVLFGNFQVATARPLAGGVPINDVVRELEADPQMSERFREARKLIGETLVEHYETLRTLRLLSGLSQDQLADRAQTTQPHIARIEAGKTDPGTDMIARLADALKLSDERLFAAVRRQRRSGTNKDG